jgi:Arc/MetJ-type ribon-helix-helix transcriptional regulator
MPKLVTRLDAELVEAVDSLVSDGVVADRSEAVRLGLEHLVTATVAVRSPKPLSRATAESRRLMKSSGVRTRGFGLSRRRSPGEFCIQGDVWWAEADDHGVDSHRESVR